jgi:hypothetical protein
MKITSPAADVRLQNFPILLMETILSTRINGARRDKSFWYNRSVCGKKIR